MSRPPFVLPLAVLGALAAGCVAAPEGEDAAADSQEQAATASCAPTDPKPSYDHYPSGGGPYPTGTPTAQPWLSGFNRKNVEDYEPYTDGRDLDDIPWIAVTSGHMEARHVGAYKRGWVEGTGATGVRALARAYDGRKNVAWTDQEVSYRANVKDWTPATFTDPVEARKQGLNVFARYRTENDLYVASYKRDGRILVQRKLCGKYTRLAEKETKVPVVAGQWVDLKLTVSGSGTNTVTFTVKNGTFTDTVTVTDTAPALASGTHGIRTDYLAGYIDDWRVR